MYIDARHLKKCLNWLNSSCKIFQHPWTERIQPRTSWEYPWKLDLLSATIGPIPSLEYDLLSISLGHIWMPRVYHIYIYTYIRICCANIQHVLRILAYCRTESHQEPWAWPLHVTCHQRCLVSLFWPSVSECLQRRFTFNRTWFFLGLGVCIKDDFDFGWSENT